MSREDALARLLGLGSAVDGGDDRSRRASADQDLHHRRRPRAQQRQPHRQGLARLSVVLHRDGLSRFDGYTFTNFGTDAGAASSTVNDLLETRGGEYWMATNAGLVRFDPKGRPAGRVIRRLTRRRQARCSRSSCRTVRTGAPGPSPCCMRAGMARSGSAPATDSIALEHANGRRSLRPSRDRYA